MIRRMLCLWMVLAVLAGACSAMAEPLDAVESLLAQLDAYLSAAETLFAVREEANRCVLDFCDERSYAGLVSARMAADWAYGQIAQLSAPELSLSESELLALITMGVETDTLEVELRGFSTTISAALEKMTSYENMLRTVLLHSDQLESLTQWAALDRQDLELDIRYKCMFLNVMLLPVAEREDVRTFWQTLAQRYPTIGGCQPEWETNKDVLIAGTVSLLDECEQINSRASENLGRASFAIDQFTQNIRSGDLEALKADVVILEDMPPMAPCPSDWLNTETAFYTASDESDGTLPETLTYWDTDVSLESFNGYINTLLEYGASLYRYEGSDEAGWSSVLIVENHALLVNWYPSGRAVVGYQPSVLSLEPYAYILCCQ